MVHTHQERCLIVNKRVAWRLKQVSLCALFRGGGLRGLGPYVATTTLAQAIDSLNVTAPPPQKPNTTAAPGGDAPRPHGSVGGGLVAWQPPPADTGKAGNSLSEDLSVGRSAVASSVLDQDHQNLSVGRDVVGLGALVDGVFGVCVCFLSPSSLTHPLLFSLLPRFRSLCLSLSLFLSASHSPLIPGFSFLLAFCLSR